MIDNYFKKGLKEGDWTSFKAMFDQYYDWLCAYVYKLSKDKSLSEDLVQNVFITIWEKRSTIVINSSVKSYFLRSCHNQYLKYLRSLKIEMTSLDTLKFETICELYEEEQELQEQRIKAITVAIETLPPKCKEAFILNKFEKFKYKEIAEMMGISIKTVENHMAKALSHLRNTVLPS